MDALRNVKGQDSKYLTPLPFHEQRRTENHVRLCRAESGKGAMYSDGSLSEVLCYVTGQTVKDGNGLQEGSVFLHYFQNGEV